MSLVNQFLALGLQTKLLIAGVSLFIIGSILQAIGDATPEAAAVAVEEKRAKHAHGVVRRSKVRNRNAASVGTSSVHRNAC